jgi:hypothetical protein
MDRRELAGGRGLGGCAATDLIGSTFVGAADSHAT